MWHDYLGIIPSTAAIINGFIAVLVAQFYRERPVAKVVLVVTAGVLGLAAIGTTVYSQHLAIIDQQSDVERRWDIRQKLGDFIEQGNALMQRCSDNSQPPPQAQEKQWEAQVETFLRDKLDGSYIIRFRDPTGVPLGVIVGLDAAHQGLFGAIRARVFRLEQFSEQFPS
jgi:hypothetical protein